MSTPDVTGELWADVSRCGLRYSDFERSYEHRENALFNVLNAYAHLESHIGYCQGMNCLAGFILRQMQNPATTCLLDKYFEEDSFYLFLYITRRHKWSAVYQDGFPKLYTILETLKQFLINDFADVWDHVLGTFDEDMHDTDILKVLFLPTIFTLFTSELQDQHTQHNVHIFDLFLLHGGSALVRIILNCIEQQRDEIKDIFCEGEMQQFFRKGMFVRTFDRLKCCGIGELEVRVEER